MSWDNAEYDPELRKYPMRDYINEGIYFTSSYEVYDDKIVINDAVWGTETIGDQPGDEVFLELVGHPVVSRLLNIEQLSLSYHHATMPNTTNFTRWESQWGSVAFVRKMTEGLDIDSRERAIMQLRTFISDLGHTAFSHMGDWLFQGFGGPENQHDNELEQLLEATGVAEILSRHGYELSEVVFPDKQDWIENDLPELCVDRVDYGVREIRRWLDCSIGIHEATDPEAFKLDEDRIIMADYQKARDFAVAFSLLPTEHWGQPTHRLQLMLLQEAIKRMFVTDEQFIINSMEGSNYNHPRDYMYSVDADFTGNLEKVDDLNWLLSTVMKQIGFEQRRIFTTVRKRDLDRWFAEYSVTGKPGKFPAPLESIVWQSNMHPLMPSNISLYPVDTDLSQPAFEETDQGIAFYLPPLKPRYVDPLFYDEDGKVKRLSEHDPDMKRYFKEQAVVMKQAYRAVLHMNEQFRTRIAKGLRSNLTEWPKELEKPRMEPEKLTELIGRAAMYSIPMRGASVYWHR